MRSLFGLLILLVVMALGAPVLAQVDADEIAAELRAEGYFAGPGVDVDRATQQALDDASIPIYLVSLAEDPGEDPSLLAQRIGDLFGSGTFVVRTPDFIGVYSVDLEDAVVEKALDDSLDAWRESDAAGVEALDKALTGKGGFPIGTVVLVGLAGLVGWGIFSGKRRAKTAVASRLEEQREALGELADEVANDILALSDRVQGSENQEVVDHYREANRIFSEVQDSLANASTEMQFEQFSSQLTEAEWRLEAAEALLDGRDVPEKPTDRPIECFFHPHKAGVEKAEIQTPAGKKTVSVCRECAERLRRGGTPTPRQVQVDGRRIPAGRAPRSYGGGGLDLDVFDVVVGAGRSSYDWGGPRRSRRARSVGRTQRTRRPSRSSSRSRPSRKKGGRASRRL